MSDELPGVREVLSTLDLLEGLSDEGLERVAAAAYERRMEPGDVLVEEGDTASDLNVLVDGRWEWSRVLDGERVILGSRPAITYAGASTLLTGEPALGTGTAIEPCLIYVIPGEEFRRLLRDEPSVLKATLRLIAPVQQTAASVIEQRERLLSLGTLSAGLAHELNNPAAAARRSAKRLASALAVLQDTVHQFVSSGIEREEAEQLVAMQHDALRRYAENGGGAGGLDAADLEDELGEALEELGVEDAWEVAPVLVEAGLDREWLDLLQERAGSASTAAVAWVAASLGARALADELAEATEHISNIVSAIRDYSRMDRAAVEEIDVHDGIESTLTILAPRLKEGSVEVVRDYGEGVPRITAHAAQLNQVWTNLIVNAIDAVAGDGTIRIRTRNLDDQVMVCVEDTGPGVPEELRSRIFDPFFTTKGVGEGTGLGLDVSRRIVEAHRGQILLESEPGRTRFDVRLPLAIDG